MKELEQALAIHVYDNQQQQQQQQTPHTINGPVHYHARHRLYLRHLGGRLAPDRHGADDKHSTSEPKRASNEDNNNIQLEGQVVGCPSTSLASQFGAGVHSASSGSLSNSTAIHLVNGHLPAPAKQTREERSHRQTSPLLSGCRRKLYLHFNKALGGAKPRWTSPPVEGQRKPKKHGFLRRRKSANRGASSDVEERPSSLSGPSEDGALTPPLPPPIPRSPSAGQIDYADLVPLNLFLHKGPLDRHGDEHRMIAYNSSLLVGSVAPVQQPYQMEAAAESVNGGAGSSSGANSVTENDHLTTTGPSATMEVNAEVDDRAGPDRPPYLVSGSAAAIATSKNSLHETNVPSDHETTENHTQQELPDYPVSNVNSHLELSGGADRAVRNAAMTPATLETFRRTHNRMCTSFRIKVRASTHHASV